MNFENTISFARKMDAENPLKGFRDKFLIPELNGSPSIYFCGNSLGLQPKSAGALLEEELSDWAELGVRGHLHAKRPWYSYHEQFSVPLGKIAGAKPEEVVAMNGLTVNLHLLFISFYRPKGKRTKILCEEKVFPSDRYAMESQIRLHGLDPAETLVTIGPEKGERCIRTEDILAKIEELGEYLALVFFGGVNYYTGQRFRMKEITAAAKEQGAMVGFDLAHAMGNVELNLHDWEVDFAAWCSYKYLNSGSGSVAGAFVHEKHFNGGLPRLAGWWGHDKNERFKMEDRFKPMPTAEAWQLSNPPVLAMAAHKAALDIFDEAGMQMLTEKRDNLTAYLEFVIGENNPGVEIITPSNKEERGCQLSLLTGEGGKELFALLEKDGIAADWREPNVIRAAPVPLYNTFEEVYRFGQVFKAGC